LERHVRQVICYNMTREGQKLLRHLLIFGRLETSSWFISTISREVQAEQLRIAVQNGIVRIDQEKIGLQRAYYEVNPQFLAHLQRVLPQILN